MNDKNNNIDDIEQILSEYKAQKSNRENQDSKPLEPPKKRDELIDFAKTDNEQKKEKVKKSAEEIKTEQENKKKKRTEMLKKAKSVFLSKKFLLSALALLLATAAIIAAIFGINNAKTAYLKPYQKAYPDVEFPLGILEKYCDDYGKNPNTVGYLSIAGSDEPIRITNENSEPLTDGANRFNYVVYLDSSTLEQQYKNADLYNSADKKISYSNLIEDCTFQVAGAFYTNTKPEDDDGYTFPYYVTEKMTLQSANNYIERINNRLLYKIKGLEITRQDTLLTISCPTDYKDGYSFVLVCKLVDEVNNDVTAENKPDRKLTDSEYKALGEVNPYRFAAKWYPEIIIIDANGSENSLQKTADDYK